MKDINKLFNKLLKKFLPKLTKAIRIDYGVGSAVSITNAKRQGKDTKMSPLSLSKKDQKANINMIETLIKDVNSDVAKKINYIVNKGITDRMDNKMVADKLKDLFNKDIPNHFTYKNRFETIAQNTSFDLMSQGSHNTATRLGATHKWIYNLMDNRTADDSRVSDSKYGTPEKAIPVDEMFSYTYKGQIREFSFGRDRTNDRSQTLYIFN